MTGVTFHFCRRHIFEVPVPYCLNRLYRTDCPKDCSDEHTYQVCGSDGNIYRNECEMKKITCGWELSNNGELCTWFDKLECSFIFFPFIEKLYCACQFASPKAVGQVIAIRAKVEQKGKMILLGKFFDIILFICSSSSSIYVVLLSVLLFLLFCIPV